jgi:hypothetical protein
VCGSVFDGFPGLASYQGCPSSFRTCRYSARVMGVGVGVCVRVGECVVARVVACVVARVVACVVARVVACDGCGCVRASG